jgi:hypothetical protein
MSSLWRYLLCRARHRVGAQCIACWLAGEQASRARHPSGRIYQPKKGDQ